MTELQKAFEYMMSHVNDGYHAPGAAVLAHQAFPNVSYDELMAEYKSKCC